ncbi:Alpha/Beta hydrolase protein [Penicillium sp. IBT 16267x]|nr:Alpha/Beta hydrolase protein [Penicillium sp. IBT 16267x]
MSAQGIFSDVIGLSYSCGSSIGTTTADCGFSYDEGVVITFSIGELVIGQSVGKSLLTIPDLVPKETSLFDPKLINRARLLYSLAPGLGFEAPVTIDSKVRRAIDKYASQIDLDASNFSDLDEPLSNICAELGLVPKTLSHTRNHLRRCEAGFKVMRDMRIPTQDGNYILGDVYLPLQPGKEYPVLVSCTIYGRRVFYSGPDLDSQDEIAAFEQAEDEWHSTSEDVEIKVPRDSWGKRWAWQRGFENIATFNTFTYVPRGYAMVKVDPRGISQTPGTRGVPGQLTSDFRDAVEWCARQGWSNGNIALVGSSFGANTQWNVASLKPTGLKCFVPYATDLDMYREAAYMGGIPAFTYLDDWCARVQACSPRWEDKGNLVELMRQHPFYDAAWETTKAKMDQADIPCFLAASQIFTIHGRGAYEAWRARSPDNTHLQLVNCDYYPWPSREAAGKILQFLDHHLKGNEQSKPEPVGIQVRLGYGKYGKSGISFYSSIFDEDVEFAGHFSAALTISSSASDADFVVTLWPVDGEGQVVPLSTKCLPEPLARGFLRASHRKTDPSKTLPERPWHTHTEADHAPLSLGEIVQVDIEMFPSAAKIRKGWKLRVDISPSEVQPDIPGYIDPGMRVSYGELHENGTDTVHVGGGRVNYVLCPTVPVKEGYPNVII